MTNYLTVLFSVVVSVLFFVAGISVFGGDYESYILNTAGTSYHRRWAFWIHVPLVILLLLASMLYPFNFVYKNFFTNRIYSFVHK